MSGRDLTDQEKKAWAAVTRHVRPMEGRSAKPKRMPKAPEPAPKAVMPMMPRAVQGLPQPQNRQNERAIRRGKQSISARFDLHGFTQDQAWQALPQFLAAEQAKGSGCVMVITGKGASGGGVLRRNFLRWLEMPEARSLVSGYAPAHPRHGGSGAWYVFLRKR